MAVHVKNCIQGDTRPSDIAQHKVTDCGANKPYRLTPIIRQRTYDKISVSGIERECSVRRH